MRSKLDAIQEMHASRLKSSEDLINNLTDKCEELERWKTTCHVYNSQLEEIKRASENNARSRSSETEKRSLLQDLRSRTLKTSQETEKLRKIYTSLEEKAKMAAEDVDKENDLFSRLDEHIFPNTIQKIEPKC